MNSDVERSHLDQVARECIHCGLCLEACPTYALTGAEPESPRGRIHLMKALLDGRIEPTPDVFEPLDSCVGCRACETACPSGVQFGRLLEGMRADVVAPKRATTAERLHWKLMLDYLLIHPRRLRIATWPLRLLQRLSPVGVQEISRLLPGALGRSMELVEPLESEEDRIPEWTPAVGESRGTVALLTGCVMDALYRRIHAASVRMLTRAGYDVWVPRSQTCCGALHRHEGDRKRADKLMLANLKAFDRLDLEAIITNSAGCGAAMKEYGHWGEAQGEAAREFASRVRDICEFLAEVGIPEPDRPVEIKAVYHDPCHLGHGQGVREAPRVLLARIPGLSLVPLPESDWCCGGAGSYTLLQPAKSEALLERKLRHVMATGADLVITGNPSCLMQLSLGLRRSATGKRLCHTVEVLDQAYRDPGKG